MYESVLSQSKLNTVIGYEKRGHGKDLERQDEMQIVDGEEG